MEEIETVIADNGQYRYRLMYDDDSEYACPREWMATEIVTPNLRSYNVATPDAEFQRQFDQIYERHDGETFARYMRIFRGIEVLPVYLYDHSAVALSVGSFIGRAQHAQWDSGQIGFAYITPAKLEETGITDYEGAISTEVEELGRWMNGEVYGYVVERRKAFTKVFEDDDEPDEEDFEWDEVDALWGMIGYEYVESEAKAAMDSYCKQETT